MIFIFVVFYYGTKVVILFDTKFPFGLFFLLLNVFFAKKGVLAP